VLLSSYAREDLPAAVRSTGAGYLHKEELDAASIRRLWDERRPSPA
jgi:hypothetical protein